MKVGIVTTWFERGAAYVSKQYEEVLSKNHEVFIYARSGEDYAVGNPIWDKPNVTWGKKISSPFAGTVIHKSDFKKWIDSNSIELVLFNEQQWFQPLLWCNEWKIKTVAYIDYYTEKTIPLFEAYDMLICNTKRHFSAFDWHKYSEYLPWGTDIELFKPVSSHKELINGDHVTFFHSCGMNMERKGTKVLLEAFVEAKSAKKLIIHTQAQITDESINSAIKTLELEGRIEIITKTVTSPGLFYLGDVYVYPTILEGIGLTIAEALSSGLATVVPDNAPMNEFVQDESNGKLIDLEKFYARHDGYYWPIGLSNKSHLTEIINDLALNPEKVIKMKMKARQSAEKQLSYASNWKNLNDTINKIEFKPVTKNVIDLINKFDNSGLKRFNRYYLAFPSFFQFLWKKVF